MSINDGGPAFPVSTRSCVSDSGYGHQDSESTWQFGGMSLRDWFAGRFASAWVIAISRRHAERGYEDEAAAVEANRLGLIQADAMLKAREAKS